MKGYIKLTEVHSNQPTLINLIFMVHTEYNEYLDKDNQVQECTIIYFGNKTDIQRFIRVRETADEIEKLIDEAQGKIKSEAPKWIPFPPETTPTAPTPLTYYGVAPAPVPIPTNMTKPTIGTNNDQK